MPYVPAAERRRQLVDAASRVIRQVGLERATTRLIAEAAGASLPSVHYAFQDKDALLAAVCEHWLQLAADLLHRLVPPDCGTEQAIGNLMRGFYEWVADDPELGLAQYELLVWAVRHRADTDLAGRFHTAYRSACREALARTLAAGHALDHELDRELGRDLGRELDDVTATMATALDGCLIRLLATGDGPAVRGDLERFIGLAVTAARGWSSAGSHCLTVGQVGSDDPAI